MITRIVEGMKIDIEWVEEDEVFLGSCKDIPGLLLQAPSVKEIEYEAGLHIPLFLDEYKY